MSRSLPLLALVLLAGCYLEDRRMLNVPEGGTSSWRFGYADGCQSGKSDAGSVKKLEKDLVRFRADDDYRAGWQQGYRECYDREVRDLLASPSPTETGLATPLPAAAPLAPATRAPTTRASAAGRRAEIEERLESLRKEMRSLEAELEALPKTP